MQNKYTMDNARWQDYGWKGDVFYFEYGEFIDIDRDEFYFRIEYKPKSDKYKFFMIYEYDELVYGIGNSQVDEFFEKHMNEDIMEATKIYMEKLMM